MKIKTTTADVIETTKYMTQYTPNPLAVIEGVCRTHRLTQDFIREFRQYITPEMFMTSYRLPRDLAENNPDLYNEEDFKNLCKYKEEEIDNEEATDAQKASAFVNAFNNANSIGSFMGLLNQSTEPEKRKIITNNIKRISLSMLSYFYNDFKSDEYKLSNQDIINIIREADSEEMNEDNIICLMGITSEIDELLLKKVKDEDTKSSILLTLSLSDEHTLTSSSYKHLSNDIKESMLGIEDVSVKEFINALAETKDLGWQSKMINSALDGEITFEKTNEVYDKELLLLVSNLPEDLIVKLTKLSKNMPNTFSYKIMCWLLENKEFSEEELIEMKDVMKKAGLFFTLRKIAKENNYTFLLDALK